MSLCGAGRRSRLPRFRSRTLPLFDDANNTRCVTGERACEAYLWCIDIPGGGDRLDNVQSYLPLQMQALKASPVTPETHRETVGRYADDEMQAY